MTGDTRPDVTLLDDTTHNRPPVSPVPRYPGGGPPARPPADMFPVEWVIVSEELAATIPASESAGLPDAG